MKNALKLIIEAICIAMDKVIDKIPNKLSDLEIDTELGAKSWNDLEDRPFYEETTRTNIVPETSIVLEEDNGYIGNLQSSLRLEAGKEYIITIDGTQYNAIGKFHEEFGIPYIGNIAAIGEEDTGESFLIMPMNSPTDTELGIKVNSDIVEHTVSIDLIESKLKQIDPKYIKDMYYEEPKKWIQVELIDDDWSGKATCKLSSTPIEWAKNNSYKIRVDGVIYEFDGMDLFGFTNATGGDVYYIGEQYAPFNTNMSFDQYPFCLFTQDFVNIYAVFEDATLNHTVDFFESEAKIKYLDSKFIKDMYYEEKDYTAVLTYTPSTLSDDTLSYNCTADEIATFRELLDNNSEITVGIGKTLYSLEFRGMSSGYYELYYNDSLVFEYYMGSTSKTIKLYYENFGFSSAPEGVEITFYKHDTLIHKIDKKYLPDDIGGASIFTVRLTWIRDDNESGCSVYSADKTFDEIVKAYEDEKIVQCDVDGGIYPLMEVSDGYISFGEDGLDGAEMGGIAIEFRPNEDVLVSYYHFNIFEEYELENLNTTDKTLVGAINEVNEKASNGGGSPTYVVDCQNPNYEEALAAYNDGKVLMMTNLAHPKYSLNSSNYIYFQDNTIYEQYPQMSNISFYGLIFVPNTGYVEVIASLFSNSQVNVQAMPLRGYLNTKNGGTLEAPLILSGDPTQNLEAATKQYVDNNKGATWDTIENKPFNKKEIVLAPKQTLTFSDVVNMGINTGILSTVIDFEVGETYTMIANGVKYECVAYEQEYMGIPIKAIGSQNFLDSVSDGSTLIYKEPYVVVTGDIGYGTMTFVAPIMQNTPSAEIEVRKCIETNVNDIRVGAEWTATEALKEKEVIFQCEDQILLNGSDEFNLEIKICNMPIENLGLELKPDKYYIVKTNGRTHIVKSKEIVLFQADEGIMKTVILGNGYILKDNLEDTGEDFCIAVYRGKLLGYFTTNLEESTLNLTISDVEEVPDKLEPKFIKDMYYDSTKVIFPMSTLTYNDAYNIHLNTDISLNLTIGDKYTVIFNGVTYNNLIAYKEDTGGVLLGGESSGYPFTIEDFSILGTMFSLVYHELTNSDTEFTLEIIKEDLHTIDPKYIDDMYYDRTKIILPKSKLTCNDTETIYMSPAGNPLGLELDEKYDVTFNGAKYECIATKDDNIGINARLGGNEYPFEIIEWTNAYGNNASFSVVCNSVPIEPENPYVFEIEITKRELRKIDNKFIDADWIAKKEENVTVLLPEVVIEDIIGNSSSGVDYYSFVFNNDDLNFTITKGKEYIVNFDGVDYVCEVQVDHSDLFNTDVMYIGNPFLNQTLVAEDNGMPFIFAHTTIANDSTTIKSMTIRKSTSHTVKFNVTEVERIIEPIPQEFLPEIPTFDLVEMGLAEIPCDGSFVFKSVDTTEIINALEKGFIDVNYMAEINLGSAFEYATMSMPCTSRLVMSKAYDLKEELNYMCVVPYNLPFPDLGVELNGKVCFIIQDGAINAKQVPDVPILDLVEFGFPPLVTDANGITLPLDESIVVDILPMLEKGLVKVRINLNDEDETLVLCGNVSCLNERTYSFTSIVGYAFISITIDRISNTIHALCKSLFADGSFTDAEEVSY